MDLIMSLSSYYFIDSLFNSFNNYVLVWGSVLEYRNMMVSKLDVAIVHTAYIQIQ